MILRKAIVFLQILRINHHNLDFGQIYNLGPKVTNTNLEFGFKIKITSPNLVEKGCEWPTGNNGQTNVKVEVIKSRKLVGVALQ